VDEGCEGGREGLISCRPACLSTYLPAYLPTYFAGQVVYLPLSLPPPFPCHGGVWDGTYLHDQPLPYFN
jgi:hypothetical protein